MEFPRDFPQDNPSEERTEPLDLGNLTPDERGQEPGNRRFVVNLDTPEPDPQYDAYTTFRSPEPSPWTQRFLRDNLRGIGVPDAPVTEQDVKRIYDCYAPEPTFRSYHGPDHGAFVGQPDIPDALRNNLSAMTLQEAESTVALAGLFHDAAYKHVDATDDQGHDAWRPSLTEFIGDVARYDMSVEGGKNVFRTYLTEEGKEDPVTKMVASIFDVGEDGIIHNRGGNEFDSALAAAKFLQTQDAPPREMIAVATLIAATVPFRPSVERDENNTIVGDGYMGELAERVAAASLPLGGETHQLGWDEVNDVMLLSVQLANRDISPFILKDNASIVVKGGREVKKEEVPLLRRGAETIDELMEVARREASAPLLYGWLKDASPDTPVPADNVPSLYLLRDSEGRIREDRESYPPQEVYDRSVIATRENCDAASLFYEAHELGITVGALIATLVDEPRAPVPGFVSSEQWHPQALPQHEGSLSKGEQEIYEELMFGTSQVDVDSAVSRKSPLAGMILGSLGNERVRALSDQLQAIRQNSDKDNPFTEADVAREFLQTVTEEIGSENMRTILTELHRVAVAFQDDPERGNPQRAEKIEHLMRELVGGSLRDYES